MASVVGKSQVTDAHRHWCAQQLAAFRVTKISDLIAQLQDETTMTEAGLSPVNLRDQSIRIQINKITRDEIHRIRVEMMTGLSEHPLAYKFIRLGKLQDQLSAIEAEDTDDEVRRRREIREILKQAKDEVGEEVEKLAEALKDQHLTVSGSLEVARRDMLEKGLRAFGLVLKRDTE